MKNILILIIFCITGGIFSSSGQQKTMPGIPQDLLLKNKEEVYIHYNSTYLLAGENLYYKFYSRDVETGKLKDLSKLGYVELIGRDGKRVFRHHLALENGSGYGDFLIPSTVPSGTYKLIGYTRWMLNAGKENFFMGDLVVINPYLQDQSEILKVEEKGDREVDLNRSFFGNTIAGNGKSYGLTTTKDVYGKREKGVIRINKLSGKSANADFSLSIKKLEEYETPAANTAITYKNIYQNPGWNTSNTILPDLRGQLISGKILGDGDGAELGGKSLVFSIPGETFFVRIAKTAQDGSFNFNRDTENYGPRAYIQLLGEMNKNFEVTLDELPGIATKNLDFPMFRVSPSMAELIKQRSIYNQVENSYVAVKRDSILQKKPSLPFYGTLSEVYNLDDFTRFPTLQETFVEIIQMSRIRKNRDGTSRFELISQRNQGIEPLLIVDGIIVQDHGDLVDYDARKIKKIGLQREEYYLGPEVFKGLIVVETVNGDFFTTLNRNYIKTQEIQNVLPVKRYFQPDYDNENYQRVPDYRLQLLWKPVVEINNTSLEIEFFTSDVPGNYEVWLEGFNDDGEAVSLRKVIRVE